MKLLDFHYSYQTIENEIEQGVQLFEGVKPTVAEILEYHLRENDENFLQWIFSDYDEMRGDINSLRDLAEDELDQVNRLREYCEE